MRILLTGAAGFIGRQLLIRLKQKGQKVKALARSHQPCLQQADELVLENLSRDSDFTALLSNIDLLIHLADGFNAYETSPAASKNEQGAQRLQASLALFRAAAQNGTQVIYPSTIKTMCGPFADHILTEQSPASPQSLYGRLKLEAEQGLTKAAHEHQTRAVILRFPVVFGSGAKGSMEQLRALLASPLPLPLAGLEPRRSLISAPGLIDAIMTILARQEPPGGVYLVHDGALSIARLSQQIRKAQNNPARLFKLPPPALAGLEKLPLIGPKALRFTRPLELDDQHFRKTFNWQPPTPLLTSLSEWSKNSQ